MPAGGRREEHEGHEVLPMTYTFTDIKHEPLDDGHFDGSRFLKSPDVVVMKKKMEKQPKE